MYIKKLPIGLLLIILLATFFTGSAETMMDPATSGTLQHIIDWLSAIDLNALHATAGLILAAAIALLKLFLRKNTKKQKPWTYNEEK